MAEYLIRIFDGNIKTNYIERRFEACDHLDAIEKIKNDGDVAREAKNKLSIEGDVGKVLDQKAYELIEL